MKTHLFKQISLRSGIGLFVVASLFVASSRPTNAVATLVDIATDATDPFNLADTEPSIAVNPANPMEIAVVAFSGNWGPLAGAQGAAPVWRSNDGGATWTKVFQIPPPVANAGGPGDQKIAFTAGSTLLVAELGVTFTLQDFVFRQVGPPNAALAAGAPYGDDQPHLDVDTTGASPCFNRLYSPWLTFNVPNPRSTVSNSINNGVALADVGAGDNSAFPNRTTRIAVAPNGRVYIIYKTREGIIGVEPNRFENAHFRVMRSDDCGATWGALGPSGVSVHRAAQVQTFFTNQFGNPAKGKVARARSSDAWIAVDPGDGDVYTSFVDQDTSGFGQIVVGRSSDLGATWTISRVTNGTHHSAYPEIAVAQNGAVGVLYVDFDDSGASTIFRHRFARSFDNGLTWIDQILQSMDPTPLPNAASGFLWGDYEGLTAVGNTFYGVFTGESIGRTTRQLDPIFFKETAEPPTERSFSYAAKIVCGLQRDPKDMRLARGFYATTINIHNPGDNATKFFKKLALTFPPEEQRPGKLMRISEDTLKPDEALKVDCNDVRRRLFPNGFPTPYIEGFIIIESVQSLDVTAVYSTAALDRGGNVTAHSSIDVEQIKERQRKETAGDLSDLIPVPDRNGFFCRLTPDGKLIVTVKNQGAGPTGPSTTTVTFSSGTASLPTPALAPGASVDLFFQIPAGCFSPDCSFRIRVDAASVVVETNETNNVASGTCIG